MKVALLGFGWAGALAAMFLGERFPQAEFIAFEAGEPGGLLRSEIIDGFIFDVGGSHIIFSNDAAALNEMLTLLGDAIRHERRAYVRLGEYLVPYPFENGLYVLPPEERAELVADLVEAWLERGPGWRPRNLLEWAEGVFGKSIAQRYLIPYNQKIWKRPLDQISADWVYIPGRTPMPDVRALVRAAAGISTVGYKEQATLFYPRSGGIQTLYKAALERV
jgi:protoporphyrinogen oxidase